MCPGRGHILQKRRFDKNHKAPNQIWKNWQSPRQLSPENPEELCNREESVRNPFLFSGCLLHIRIEDHMGRHHKDLRRSSFQFQLATINYYITKIEVSKENCCIHSLNKLLR